MEELRGKPEPMVPAFLLGYDPRMSTFRILSVDVNHGSYRDHSLYGYLAVDVVFDSREVSLYGSLLEYMPAVVVTDPEAVEAHYAERLEEDEQQDRSICDDFVEDPERPGQYVYRPTKPSPYDLGLMKSGWVRAAGVLQHADPNQGSLIRFGPGRFRFSTTCADCLVTRAAILEITNMMKDLQSRHCRYGNFPEQAGAFRSGDAEHDFAGLLEVLHRFWD